MIEVEGYKIYFVHHILDAPALASSLELKEPDTNLEVLIRGYTECYMVDHSEENMYVTRAYCSVHDNYRRSAGRKVSLTHMLSGWPKEFRTKVWKAYFKKLDVDFIRSKYGNDEAKRWEESEYVTKEEFHERLGRDNVA